jgi:hypothetical protein
MRAARKRGFFLDLYIGATSRRDVACRVSTMTHAASLFGRGSTSLGLSPQVLPAKRKKTHGSAFFLYLSPDPSPQGRGAVPKGRIFLFRKKVSAALAGLPLSSWRGGGGRGFAPVRARFYLARTIPQILPAKRKKTRGSAFFFLPVIYRGNLS